MFFNIPTVLHHWNFL